MCPQVSFDEDTLCYHDSQPPSAPKLASQHTDKTSSGRNVTQHVTNGTRNPASRNDITRDTSSKPGRDVGGRDARVKPTESKVDRKLKRDDDFMDILIR